MLKKYESCSRRRMTVLCFRLTVGIESLLFPNLTIEQLAEKYEILPEEVIMCKDTVERFYRIWRFKKTYKDDSLWLRFVFSNVLQAYMWRKRKSMFYKIIQTVTQPGELNYAR